MLEISIKDKPKLASCELSEPDIDDSSILRVRNDFTESRETLRYQGGTAMTKIDS
jgi:hypothetical protein